MLFANRHSISQVSRLARELDGLLLAPLFRKYSLPPPEITHYTSVQALSSILSSGNLRMSHFRHLNDSTEMLHGRRVVNDMLKAEVERHDSTSPFFDYCRFAFNEQDDTAIQYFVSSFSVLTDDLELWSRYGGNGGGVALTFDTKRMGAEPAEPFTYYIARVTYSSVEQGKLLSPLVNGARSIVARYVRQYGYDVRDVAVQVLAAKLCSHLNHHSISLKDEQWSLEREWRTVFSVLSNDPEERRGRVKLRADGRPYVDVSVRSVEPEDLRMPIVRVTTGRRADTGFVRKMLDDCGYQNAELRCSKTSEGTLAS